MSAPDRLRFDFSHYQALTDDEIRTIEDLANHEVLANARVRHYETTKENAEQLCAIAFFGDKYGDIVRVLEACERSLELSGRHTRARIGRHRSDEDRVRGIDRFQHPGASRRLPDSAPIDRLRDEEATLGACGRTRWCPVRRARAGHRKASGREQRARRRICANCASNLPPQARVISQHKPVDGIVVARHDGIDRDALRDLAFAVRDQPAFGR
jgi:alanyl-tRNA synthetase